MLAEALNAATGEFLDNNRSPSRKVNELDTEEATSIWRWYWPKHLRKQTKDAELRSQFAPIARQLAADETKIIAELNAAQGSPVDIGGYYHADAQHSETGHAPQHVPSNAVVDSLLA